MNLLLSLVAKVPWLGTAWSFVTSKARLVIEYVLIAAVITLAGVTLTLWSQKNVTENKLVTVQQRLTAVELTRAQQDATIRDLTELRKQDAVALSGLIDDYKALTTSDQTTRRHLKELESSNETVRRYLSHPLPPDLACLLNGTCSGNCDKNRTAPTSVPACPKVR